MAEDGLEWSALPVLSQPDLLGHVLLVAGDDCSPPGLRVLCTLAVVCSELQATARAHTRTAADVVLARACVCESTLATLSATMPLMRRLAFTPNARFGVKSLFGLRFVASLRELSVSGCVGLNVTDASWAIATLTQLTGLDVSHTPFTETCFARVLAALTRLQHLDAAFTLATVETVRFVTTLTNAEKGSLTSVCLSGVQAVACDASCTCALLSCGLQSLLLNDMTPSETLFRVGYTPRAGPELRVLSLNGAEDSKRGFGSANAVSMLRPCATWCALTRLSLQQQKLTSEFIDRLSSAAVVFPVLQSLDVSLNDIFDDALMFLPEVAPALTELSVVANPVGSASMSTLAVDIPGLARLAISPTDDDARALGDALSGMHALSELSLSGSSTNCVTATACVGVLTSLSSAPSLHGLTLPAGVLVDARVVRTVEAIHALERLRFTEMDDTLVEPVVASLSHLCGRLAISAAVQTV